MCLTAEAYLCVQSHFCMKYEIIIEFYVVGAAVVYREISEVNLHNLCKTHFKSEYFCASQSSIDMST